MLSSVKSEGRQLASGRHFAAVLVIVAIWAATAKLSTVYVQTSGRKANHFHSYGVGILIEWLVLAFVLFGVRRFGAPVDAVIGPRWRGIRDVARDILIALIFLLVSAIVLAFLAWLFPGRPNLQRFLPHGAAEISLWVALSLSAGICEEAIFRGYLQGQLASLRTGTPAAILISAAIFGIAHIYQGPRQVAFIAVYGAMFGMLAHLRGSVRPGMIAHFLNDAVIGLAAGIAAQHAA